ncbi:ANTAR domain-containing response regulator [Notoacmeibacter sp. MSK16QG-6]|uniref:ANTAR domain-containing response regulator n=1 Tax=Notoacmeibacter sp. MSK16QG-6 TaxID=2957982 RepID=UPI0020A0A0F1|nr:ANTAR domain-containing protein [Notoacmeibacter sp. MSK16QG-6]MCP1200594.1 ANTAR domain-containing protein [Notoacmeibacter sp. MSK16QG-6]
MSGNPLEIFSRLNLTLITELDEQGMVLMRQLQRTRAQVMHRWPMPERIGENTDMVLCEYSPDLSRRYAWMPGEAGAAVVVLAPGGAAIDLAGLKAALPDAVLHRPYGTGAVSAALILAWDHFTQARRQSARIARLDENVRSLRQIERAKHLIMKQKNISESNAISELRNMAMSRRISMAALASQLVDSKNNVS